MPTVTIGSDQIWLKGTGSASQVWSFTVSGIPAGATINSAALGFSTGNTYATPGGTAVYWGSTSGTKLWSVSGSGGGTEYTVNLKSYIKGNGSFSLCFYKAANDSASQSNVYFSSLAITIDYTNPVSGFTLSRTSLSVGEKLTVTITRADNTYTHKVKYALGSKSYTETDVETSASYTIPYSWVDQITDGSSLDGKVTVTTLNASGGTVGSVSKAVTVKWINTKSDFEMGTTTLKVGEKLSITISRKVSTYTHKVKYALGTRSYTATGATTSSSYTIPLEWVDQITDGVSLNGRVTVETLQSDGTSLGTVSRDVTVKWADTKSSLTLSSSSLDAGSKLTVTITRQVSSYTHKVVYSFGSRSYTATGVGTSSSYTIPVSWLDQIPNAVSGAGKVTVTTLNASGGTVGSASASVTIKAGSSVVPSVGTITAEAVSGLDGLYIQGYSKCKVTVSGHSAGTGATVASVLISGNGSSAWATSMTSSLLRTSGTVTFTVKVTDSRGRATSGTVSITVQAYKAVTITGRTALRCKSDGTVSRVTGKSAKLGVSYTMTTVGSNAGTVKVYWRVYGASSWTQISGWSSTSGYTAVALTDALALDKRYEIRFDVADKMSTASQTAVIEPGAVYMVWSKVKSSFGLGTYPTAEKQVAIAEDWSLMLGSVNVGNALGQRTRVRNLLKNSCWINRDRIINQAGKTTYDTSGTTIDKWIIGNGTLEVHTTYLTVVSDDDNACVLKQFVGKLPDGTYTFAAYINGTVRRVTRNVSGTSLTTVYSESAYTGGYLTFEYDSTNGEFFVTIRANAGSYRVSTAWAALYEGTYSCDSMPTYVPKPLLVEMHECGMTMQPYNWLDNSYFANTVNQRGASSFTGAVYGIDRWYGISVNQTLTTTNLYVKIAATGTSYVGMAQKVLQMSKLAGKTVTLAARVWSNVVPNIRFVDASNSTLASADGVANKTQVLTLTYTVPSGATADSVIPRILARTAAADDAIYIYWAALYEGGYNAETIPPYVPKGYEVELAECQRQFWRCNNTYFAESCGYAYSATVCRVSIPVPQNFRTTPTMTAENGDTTSYGIRVIQDGQVALPTSVTLSTGNNRIKLTLNGSWTTNAIATLRLESALQFSAEP